MFVSVLYHTFVCLRPNYQSGANVQRNLCICAAIPLVRFPKQLACGFIHIHKQFSWGNSISIFQPLIRRRDIVDCQIEKLKTIILND